MRIRVVRLNRRARNAASLGVSTAGRGGLRRNKIVAGDPSPGSWSRHYTCAKPITKQLDDFLMVARQVSMAGRRKTPAWPGRFEAAAIIVAAAVLSPLCLSPCIFAAYGWFCGLTGRCPCPPWPGTGARQPGGLMGNLRGCPPAAGRPKGPGYRGGPLATEVGVLEPAGNVDRGKRCR